jgi:hypothetical protein
VAAGGLGAIEPFGISGMPGSRLAATSDIMNRLTFPYQDALDLDVPGRSALRADVTDGQFDAEDGRR